MHSPLIPAKEYDRIVEQMPICCVDLLPINDGQFLLSWRINDPGKDQWFPVGGRIYKGETLIDAAMRKLREELGVTMPEEAFKQIFAGETIFHGKTVDQNRHSVNIVYVVELNDMAFVLDSTQLAEVAWFSSVNSEWHPYVREILSVAGFNE